MKYGNFFLYMFCLLFVLIPIHSGIILTSVPKCGTHLAITCIKAITGLNGVKRLGSWISFGSEDLKAPFLVKHAIYSPEHDRLIKQHKSKGILILRDPRDQCISWYAFIAGQNPDIWPRLPLKNFNDFISTWIQDTSTLYSSRIHLGRLGWYDQKILSFKGIDDLYHKYLPWIHNTSFYTTTFEKLVGPQGGGSQDLQVQEIINIAQHLGYSITEARAILIAQTLFGDGATFRKGQIGSWRNYFTPEHKKLFKQVAGQLLIDLGYEKDLNW